MKKIILSLVVIATGFWGQSQVICAGVSPANIAGNYAFFWADPAGADWASPDFLTPGVFVQDTLMMVDDGTPGNHATYGHPLAQQSCAPLINDLTGKIAVLFRGDCEFGFKALQAQNAGAVAVIIVNHTGDAVGMAGGVEGLNVTIPVVMLGQNDGDNIITEMGNGPVVMFLGNKVGAYTNDVGANSDELLISPFSGSNSKLDNGFNLGIQLYNFGSDPQSNITITANIDGPSGNVYNNVINAPMLTTGDTLSIFNGNPYAFPPFDLGGVGMYPAGVYTLTYSLDLGIADDSDFDNVFTSTFTVNPDVISLSRIDGSNMPIDNTYPSNSTSEYQSCMFFVNPNASDITIDGLYFVPYTDLTVGQLSGAEIFVNVYLWDDAWVDLNDPNYGLVANDFFQALSLLAYETYYPASDAENGLPQFVPFTPLTLTDNQRYLFCLQSYDPAIAFGYDNGLNYDGNQGISAMPVSPVNVDGTWYTGGWQGTSAPSIALSSPLGVGIEEVVNVAGMAYPNPAKDVVTVSIASEGSANLTISDVSGKVVANSVITLVDGKTNVNIVSLEAGVYIFNVALENGLTSQFNVIKQ